MMLIAIAWFGTLFLLKNATSSMVAIDPFDSSRELYVSPYFKNDIDSSMDLHPNQSSLFAGVKSNSVAFWLDEILAINNASHLFERAIYHQSIRQINYTLVLVIFNLPNKDCATDASSSTREIS